METALVPAGVMLALIFGFTNGLNDSASLVASTVATRAMQLRHALWFVAVFELLGPLLVGSAVAATIGGILDVTPGSGAEVVVAVALLGAVVWNASAATLGVPTSASHALVGGLIGSQIAATGDARAVNWGIESLDPLRPVGVVAVVLALLVAPLIGFVAGFIAHRALTLALGVRRATPGANHRLRRLQVAAAAALAFGHGANDAQKTMGVVTMLLLAGGHIDSFVVPFWVRMSAAIAIASGVLLGARRTLRTLGSGIFRIRPIHGLSSQAAAATVIIGGSLLGGPVSTPHVASSAITGVGSSARRRSVRWGTVRGILWSWVVTIPVTALLSALLFIGQRALR